MSNITCCSTIVKFQVEKHLKYHLIQSQLLKISDLNLRQYLISRNKLWIKLTYFGKHSVSQAVQSLSHVRLFATPWLAARQASLSITNSWSLLKFMPIESVMPSSHLILCRLLLLLPPTPPGISTSLIPLWCKADFIYDDFSKYIQQQTLLQ